MSSEQTDLYAALSLERKQHQAEGKMPSWYTTAGWQMFKEKYLYYADSVREQFQRIARTAAKHLASVGREDEAYGEFFELLWNGWLSCSTPVLANMGTTRGMPVSCSGSSVPDSIDGFYSSYRETALLTKNGFGTSGYLGDIRSRKTPISKGGKASGAKPVFEHFIKDMQDVRQGTARRGAWAAYYPITGGDFHELADHVMEFPDDANIGWVVTDAFIEQLNAGDHESISRYQKVMKLKMVTGKGYLFFVDKVNRRLPAAYLQNNLNVHMSNLCTEITLFCDDEHTFSCVLSSMNVSKWHEWKNTDAVFWATIFLDCVASEFIERAQDEVGLEKVVRFTEKGRALGLGQCGFHTLLQQERMPFESMPARYLSQAIAKHIDAESLRASQALAEALGEPEWCRGLGVRNTHRIAIAPTKSTALLMGGVSEGINPDPAMSFTQLTAAGEVDRVVPELLKIMKERDVYTKHHLTSLRDANGSVQHVAWLSEEEKKVFKTAFEINQETVLTLAAARTPYIDQAQSINLFFSADEDPAWISHVHQQAFMNENILSLYYVYTQSGVSASKGECEVCS